MMTEQVQKRWIPFRIYLDGTLLKTVYAPPETTREDFVAKIVITPEERCTHGFRFASNCPQCSDI